MKVPDTIVAGPEALTKLGDLTNGQLADVVVDATGHHESMSRCFEFATFAARVVYVGITVKDLVFPHAPIMHRRELTLLASRNALSADFTRIIALIEEGRIDTRPWLTHRADFADVPAIFPTWLQPQTGVIKAVVNIPAT